MKYDKIFVIGFNKTATTTFSALFKKLGLTSIHSTNWTKENRLEILQCFTDGYKHTQEKDPTYFKNLEKLYPNSLFILNVRNLTFWLLSRSKQGIWLNSISGKNTKTYWPPTIKRYNTWINQRKKHHAAVLEYFKNTPQKLLIVNVDKKDWISFVASHIGKDFTKTLKRNVSSQIDPTDPDFILAKKVLDKTFKKLNYTKLEKESLNLTDDLFKLYKNNID